MIRGIGHLALTVQDMGQSLDFYCTKLGFSKAFELNRPTGEPWIIYIKIADRQFIELFYGDSSPIETKPTTIGFNHLCIEVDDINEIANHLKRQGLTLDVEPKQGLDRNWQCWIRDPDGNRIEFMQLVHNSPQMNC